MEQGFILTRYFYDTLIPFEKDPAGIRSDYPDWLTNIDLGKEAKLASNTHFASEASPELLHISRPHEQSLQQHECVSVQAIRQSAHPPTSVHDDDTPHAHRR
jgi:hypothetical protein